MSPHLTGILLASVTAVSWSALAIGLKYSLGFASAGSIVWFRMLVAFVVMSLLTLLPQNKNIRYDLRRLPWIVVLAGVGLAANYFGYLKAVELSSASNAQVMIQIGPMSLALVGILVFKEIPTRLQVIGMLVALLGFSLFFGDQLLTTLQNQSMYLAANSWVVIAAWSWVAYSIITKIYSASHSVHSINLLVYFIAMLALLPLAHFSDFSELTLGQWALLFLLGLNTLVAYGCLALALKKIPASQVSMIIVLNPLLTLLFFALMDHYDFHLVAAEPIQLQGYVGALLVVTGVILAIQKKNSRLISPKPSTTP